MSYVLCFFSFNVDALTWIRELLVVKAFCGTEKKISLRNLGIAFLTILHAVECRPPKPLVILWMNLYLFARENHVDIKLTHAHLVFSKRRRIFSDSAEKIRVLSGLSKSYVSHTKSLWSDGDHMVLVVIGAYPSFSTDNSIFDSFAACLKIYCATNLINIKITACDKSSMSRRNPKKHTDRTNYFSYEQIRTYFTKTNHSTTCIMCTC